MSAIVYPGFEVASFRWNKMDQAIPFRSAFGSQALVTSGPLWEVEINGPQEKRLNAHVVEAFIESLNGFSNQVELWNLQQEAPTGTMRGTMVFAANAAQGATSISISAGAGEAGKTLLKHDLIGFGTGTTQQVVRILADATADGAGVIALTLGAPLRNAFAAGASVTWDKPKALFRQKALNNGIEYIRSFGRPWSLSLVEDWRP